MKPVLAWLAVAVSLVGAGPARAVTNPCALLEVPAELGLICRIEPGVDADHRSAVVEPEDAALAAFSRLVLTPLDGPVADPAARLRDGVRLGLDEVADSLRHILDSPDNPLAGSRLNESLKTWLNHTEMIDDYPLTGCREPAPRATGGDWQMDCHWRFAGVEEFYMSRLVERPDGTYLITIRAMTRRRLRHLVAIANSL
jgi:hypothetical protein